MRDDCGLYRSDLRQPSSASSGAVRRRTDAALNGLGLACLPDHALHPFLAEGRLQQVLEDWCPLSRPGAFGLDLKPNAQRRGPHLGFRGQ
ncbi:MAG: hypothetical protein E5W09_18305 [Mesorhizobium sp.]|nr:MAG: hypothetical protein E5W94_05430 [Mesorhizobium sp.]TIU96258.1 MAG: hypothetical protein E5W09_18305 [Mesorhizobium sp.]TIX84901.1 MAG: hypothetical protein E5V24_17605 [Mesorhizobium sp.]